MQHLAEVGLPVCDQSSTAVPQQHAWLASPGQHQSTTSIQTRMVGFTRSTSINNIHTDTHGWFHLVNINLQYPYRHAWLASPVQHQSTTSIQTRMVGFTRSTLIYIHTDTHGWLHPVSIKLQHPYRHAWLVSPGQHQSNNIHTDTHGWFHQVNINQQHPYRHAWLASPGQHQSTTSIQTRMVGFTRSALIYNIHTDMHGWLHQVNINLQHSFRHAWLVSPGQYQSTTSIQTCMVGFTRSTSIYNINTDMHGWLHQFNINLQHPYRHAWLALQVTLTTKLQHM